MRGRLFAASFCTGIALIASASLAGPFTAGNLVVSQVGDGSITLSGAANPVFIVEFTQAGVPVQSVAMPTTVSGNNRRLTDSGSATSNLQLTRSVDLRFLTVSGYDAALGTSAVTASNSATVNRVVGLIDSAGIINTTTALTDAYSGDNFRATVTDDGTRFWLGGTGTNPGVRFTTLGATTSVSLANNLTNIRNVNIYSGQLYCSSSSGSFRGVSRVGTGLPTTGGNTIVILPGFPTTAGPSTFDFYFADDNTVYVADDRAAASGGGVQKWTFDGSNWSLQYTFTNGLGSVGCRGLTGANNGGTVTLFAITGEAGLSQTRLVTVTDAGASSSFTVLATSPSQTSFRGVDFTPEGSAIVDCNTNSIPDGDELAGNDCDSNSVLDVCELAGRDCDTNNTLDACELSGRDCDLNGIVDECEIVTRDCNSDGTIDACQLSGNDCNANGRLDSCEITGQDCDTNGTIDDCDVNNGQDANSNGVVDVCERAYVAGNIVVSQFGADGSSNALTAGATQVLLKEFEIAGGSANLVHTRAMPVIVRGANKRFTNSGTSTSEGALTRSADGRYLTLAGYDATPGFSSVVGTSAAAVNRVVARVDSAGNINTTTALADAYNENNIRSAVTDDGTRFWTGGTGQSTSAGVRYSLFGGTSSTLISETVLNTRVVNIYFGQLLVSTQSGQFRGVNSVGTGLPVTSGQTITLFPGFDSSSTSGENCYDYFLADPSTLYVADERSAETSDGGLQKWTFDGANWNLAYILNGGLPNPAVGLRGVTGALSDGIVTIYAITAEVAGQSTNLVTLTEPLNDTAPNNFFQTLATSPQNTCWRGVEFAPVGGISCLLGDLNNDGVVDGDDMDGYVRVTFGGGGTPQELCAANLSVQAFVALLLGQ